MSNKESVSKYEVPFWKAFVWENLNVLHPKNWADLFGLLLACGMIGLAFSPIISVLSIIYAHLDSYGTVNLLEWYFDRGLYISFILSFMCGMVSFLSYQAGSEKVNHYLMRRLHKLLNDRKIDDKVYLEIITNL